MQIANCPKCGSTASLLEAGDDSWIVDCDKCAFAWEPETGTKQEAIRCWNAEVKRIKQGKEQQ